MVHVMKNDFDPQVRNTAAYALGGIDEPGAIPAFMEAMESDDEPDELGQTASGCAATALDDIRNTNRTRMKESDGLCSMQPAPLQLEVLKSVALKLDREIQS